VAAVGSGAGSRASLVLTEEDSALLAMDSPRRPSMTPRAFHAARYRLRKKMMAHRSEQRAAAGLAAKGGADEDAEEKTLANLGLQPVAVPLLMGLCRSWTRTSRTRTRHPLHLKGPCPLPEGPLPLPSYQCEHAKPCHTHRCSPRSGTRPCVCPPAPPPHLATPQSIGHVACVD